jgi:RHS repeat-associated protein
LGVDGRVDPWSPGGLTDDRREVLERHRYNAGACPEQSRGGACTVLDARACPERSRAASRRSSDDSDNASDVEHSASARRGETSREPAGRVPQGCNGGAGHNPFLFTGRRLDSEWAGMQYRNRSYSTTLGRFVSRDPAGYDDGPNLYALAGGSPTITGDPTGLGRIEVRNRVVLFTGKRPWRGTRIGKVVTVAGTEVVQFYSWFARGYHGRAPGLDDTPLDVVVHYGSKWLVRTPQKLRGCIGAAQASRKFYRKGLEPTDYYMHRVKPDECRRCDRWGADIDYNPAAPVARDMMGRVTRCRAAITVAITGTLARSAAGMAKGIAASYLSNVGTRFAAAAIGGAVKKLLLGGAVSVLGLTPVGWVFMGPAIALTAWQVYNVSIGITRHGPADVAASRYCDCRIMYPNLYPYLG